MPHEKVTQKSNKTNISQALTHIPFASEQPESGEDIMEYLGNTTVDTIDVPAMFEGIFECFKEIANNKNEIKLLTEWNGRKKDIGALITKLISDLKNAINDEDYEHAQEIVDLDAQREYDITKEEATAEAKEISKKKAAKKEELEAKAARKAAKKAAKMQEDDDEPVSAGDFIEVDDEPVSAGDFIEVDGNTIQNSKNDAQKASVVEQDPLKEEIQQKEMDIKRKAREGKKRQAALEQRQASLGQIEIGMMFQSAAGYTEYNQEETERELAEQEAETDAILGAGEGYIEDTGKRRKKEQRQRKKERDKEISSILGAGAGYTEDTTNREEEERRKEKELKKAKKKEYKESHKDQIQKKKEEKRALKEDEDAIFSLGEAIAEDFSEDEENKKHALERKERLQKAAEKLQRKKEESKKSAVNDSLEDLQELIEALESESLYLKLAGYSEGSKKDSSVENSLRTFVRSLIALYNFWASDADNRPDLMVGATNNKSESDSFGRSSQRKSPEFEVLLDIDDNADLITYKIGQARQLNNFFSGESKPLESSWKSFVDTLKARSEAEKEGREKIRELLPPSQEARENESIIEDFKSEFTKDDFKPAEMLNETKMDEVIRNLQEFQKIVSKQNPNSKKEADQFNYISNLSNVVNNAIVSLKSRKTEYPKNSVEKMHAALLNQYGGKGNGKGNDITANDVQIKGDIKKQNVYPLKEANNFIRAIEYAASSVLSRISIKSEDGSQLPAVIVDNTRLADISQYLLNLLHSPVEEKKFNFLNTLYINGLITDIEDEDAAKQMYDEMTEEKIMELQDKLRNLRRQDQLMGRTELFELSEISNKLAKYSGKNINMAGKMASPETDDRMENDDLIKSDEDDSDDDSDNVFTRPCFENARMIARVCGTIAEANKKDNFLRGFIYNDDNSKLKKSIVTINEKISAQNSIALLKRAISEFTSELRAFNKALKNKIPDEKDNRTSVDIKPISKFSEGLGKYIEKGVYDEDLSSGFEEAIKGILGSDREFSIYYKPEDNDFKREYRKLEVDFMKE